MPNYFQIFSVVFEKKNFLKFSLYRHGENWPRPLMALFFNDQYDLNNLGRGSPKDHYFQIGPVVDKMIF